MNSTNSTVQVHKVFENHWYSRVPVGEKLRHRYSRVPLHKLSFDMIRVVWVNETNLLGKNPLEKVFCRNNIVRCFVRRFHKFVGKHFGFVNFLVDETFRHQV